MKALITFLDQRSSTFIWIISIVTTALIGISDYLVGEQYSTALFYILPVAIAAWFGSRLAGVLLALLAAAVWLLAEVGNGAGYSGHAVYAWNTGIRLGIFLLFAVLLANFRELLRQMETTALRDYLTGALNRRGFNLQLAEELARCRRHQRQFSVAYLDADNFKKVNDVFGHAAGDRLLLEVAEIISSNLRRTDAVARLGGDEFSILFSETDAAAVKSAFEHISARLQERMALRNWPVTFSVGIVSFAAPPGDVEEILATADALMYSVKHSEKNNVVYTVWPDERRAAAG